MSSTPVDPKHVESASLPGAVTMRTIGEGDDAHDSIVQEGYGEWPYCTLCQPPRQIEPTSFSQHTNKHSVALVDD